MLTEKKHIITVGYRWNYSGYKNEYSVPCITICGKWLQKNGFDFGDKIEINASDGFLQIKRINLTEHEQYR